MGSTYMCLFPAYENGGWKYLPNQEHLDATVKFLESWEIVRRHGDGWQVGRGIGMLGDLEYCPNLRVDILAQHIPNIRVYPGDEFSCPVCAGEVDWGAFSEGLNILSKGGGEPVLTCANCGAPFPLTHTKALMGFVVARFCITVHGMRMDKPNDATIRALGEIVGHPLTWTGWKT